MIDKRTIIAAIVGVAYVAGVTTCVYKTHLDKVASEAIIAEALSEEHTTRATAITTKEITIPVTTEALTTHAITEAITTHKATEAITEAPTETTTTHKTNSQPGHADVKYLAHTIWGEAGGIADPAERAAVAWCILNRVDAWGGSIADIATAPNQFYCYNLGGDCPQEHIDLAADVLTRWQAEKAGAENVGRVLPSDYMFFVGDGAHNHFTTTYQGTDYWDWSLSSPY